MSVEIEPVLLRHVGEERVEAAAVVEHQVFDDLDASLVSLADEIAVILIRAEPRVHIIIIGDGISVIRLHFHVVLEHWCGPDGRDAELSKIVEAVGHAFQVAAMPGHRYVAVADRLTHAFHYVVLPRAVGETVGHEQVNHVGCVEGLTVIALLLPELIVECGFAFAIGQLDLELTGCCSFRIYIKNQIVGVFHFYHLLDGQSVSIFERRGQFGDVVSMDEQLKNRVFHSAVPAKWMNEIDDFIFLGLGSGSS